MDGADKYYDLFDGKSQQIGRLFFRIHKHARGKCFHIFLLPEGEEVIKNRDNNPLNKNAVEVYGLTAGQRGWTESYGWLHEGKWQDDFYLIVEQKETDELKKILEES